MLNEIYKNKLFELLEKGKTISFRASQGTRFMRVDIQESFSWFMSCQLVLENVYGRGSYYFTSMDELKKNIHLESNFLRALSIVESACDGIESYLLKVKEIARSEVFSDFLEQAEHLFEKGYYLASVLVASGVLEDCLLKLSQNNSVELDTKSKNGLSYMNDQLCKKEVYHAIAKSKINTLIQIRNKAVHGEFSEVENKDVKDFLEFLKMFLVSYYK